MTMGWPFLHLTKIKPPSLQRLVCSFFEGACRQFSSCYSVELLLAKAYSIVPALLLETVPPLPTLPLALSLGIFKPLQTQVLHERHPTLLAPDVHPGHRVACNGCSDPGHPAQRLDRWTSKSEDKNVPLKYDSIGRVNQDKGSKKRVYWNDVERLCWLPSQTLWADPWWVCQFGWAQWHALSRGLTLHSTAATKQIIVRFSNNMQELPWLEPVSQLKPHAHARYGLHAATGSLDVSWKLMRAQASSRMNARGHVRSR